MKKLFTAFFLLTAVLLVMCFRVWGGDIPPTQYNFPMIPSAWTQFYNSMAGDTLTPGPPMVLIPGGGLREVFPSRANIKQPLPIRYNYLCHPTSGINITKNSQISASVGISTTLGDPPTFEFISPSNTCVHGCNPVSATLMIMGPVGGADSLVNRWYAFKKSWPLVLGKTTITADLNDASQWEGVQSGNPTPGHGALLFAASKAKVINACIVFGGGFYAGHGTNTLGMPDANFLLFSYGIQ